MGGGGGEGSLVCVCVGGMAIDVCGGGVCVVTFHSLWMHVKHLYDRLRVYCLTVTDDGCCKAPKTFDNVIQPLTRV